MLIKDLSSLPSCFLTATDTDAGKTYLAVKIIKAWQRQGLSVAAFKPIASGATIINQKLVNPDAQLLSETTGQTSSEVNPYCFEMPASPHLADHHATFNLSHCLQQYQQLQQKYDRIVVEGVGGWCVPISETLMLTDLVSALKLPVVLVVKIALGCINHSLLTIAQIHRDQQPFHGWIANQIDPDFTQAQANIESINNRIPSITNQQKQP